MDHTPHVDAIDWVTVLVAIQTAVQAISAIVKLLESHVQANTATKEEDNVQRNSTIRT